MAGKVRNRLKPGRRGYLISKSLNVLVVKSGYENDGMRVYKIVTDDMEDLLRELGFRIDRPGSGSSAVFTTLRYEGGNYKGKQVQIYAEIKGDEITIGLFEQKFDDEKKGVILKSKVADIFSDIDTYVRLHKTLQENGIPFKAPHKKDIIDRLRMYLEGLENDDKTPQEPATS